MGVVRTEEKGREKFSLRHYRGHQEIEHFYRFIYENGLRREAAKAFEFIQKNLATKGKKAAKSSKARKLQ